MAVSKYIAVDPGLSGGVAMLANLGPGGAWVRDTPTMPKKPKGRQYDEPAMRYLLTMLSAPQYTLAVIERQQAFPETVRGRKQGLSSTFRTGEGYGLWRGIFVGLEIPYSVIGAVQWKKSAGLPVGATKEDARLLAIERFPWIADELKLKRHHGRAEALLMAEVLLRKSEGEER